MPDFERYAEAIAAREADIGAFVHLDIENARQAASSTVGPLAGAPVAIKDIIDVFDMPTECGSPIYAGRRAISDAPVVSMIRRAGGVIMGKSTTTEFAHAHPTATRNPHHTSHTPGGSSAGSAASVAAGFVRFAVGTQTAGSVVRPAAFCGVAGYKPSFDLLPFVGVKTFAWTLDTLGLFASDVADVAFFAQAITGRALATAPAPDWRPRIGILDGPAVRQASAAMRAAVAGAAEAATRAGAVVSTVTLGELYQAAQDAQVVIQEYEGFRSLAWEYDNHRDQLSDSLRNALTRAEKIPTDSYLTALDLGRQAREKFGRVLGDIEVLLLPSAPGAAPHDLATTGSPILNRLWSLLGVPAVNVPGRRDPDGLPLGLQVVAAPGADLLALQAAAWLEGC